MADLDEIYNTRILELAGAISRTERLEHADARATAHSKLCGSTVTIDLALRDGRVSDYGQSVKACLLGQASASVMAREIVGSTPDELHAVARKMRAMLKDAPRVVKADGLILMEIGAYQGDDVTAIAQPHFPLAQITVKPDYAGLDRLVVIEVGGN